MRITRVTTRTGDAGETGLAGGGRVSKDSPRIWALGSIDELNSAIGMARSFLDGSRPGAGEIDAILARIQEELFEVGAVICTPPEIADATSRASPCSESVARLDGVVSDLSERLGPLQEFILPAGTCTASALHLARTACRRAERWCVRLDRMEKLGGHVLAYVNRLGDALFVLARWANRVEGRSETYWKHR
jgi:cob(I)alamin adenosyltransferase